MSESFKHQLRALADGLAMMLIGAWLICAYIGSRQAIALPEIRTFLRYGPYLATLFYVFGLQRQRAKAEALRSLGPSPFVSAIGLTIVLAVGAAVFLWDQSRPVDERLASLIVVVILIGGAGLAFFARKHAGEIGEARFAKDGTPLGPWTPPER